jgi:hypothetical protein
MGFMDNEFEVLHGGLLLHEIALNTCAPGEHVPEIERRIRTVKERVRGLVHTIPFQKLPTIMIVHIAIFSVMWLNFFPPKDGISPTLPPQAILTGIRVDHDKHCRISFGGYAQVHAEHTPTNNAMESRTVGGVSLGPTGNIQGSYNFLSLLAGQRIKARSFTPLPMPADAIATVESFAPAAAVRDPVFQNRNGRLDWETDVDNPEEYHDAQEYVPPDDPNDVPLWYDDAIWPLNATPSSRMPQLTVNSQEWTPMMIKMKMIRLTKDPPTLRPPPTRTNLKFQECRLQSQKCPTQIQECKLQSQEWNTTQTTHKITHKKTKKQSFLAWTAEPTANMSRAFTQHQTTMQMQLRKMRQTTMLKNDAPKLLPDREAGSGLTGICSTTTNLLEQLFPRMHTLQACKLLSATTQKKITPGGTSTTRSSSMLLPNTL